MLIYRTYIAQENGATDGHINTFVDRSARHENKKSTRYKRSLKRRHKETGTVERTPNGVEGSHLAEIGDTVRP